MMLIAPALRAASRWAAGVLFVVTAGVQVRFTQLLVRSQGLLATLATPQPNPGTGQLFATAAYSQTDRNYATGVRRLPCTQRGAVVLTE